MQKFNEIKEVKQMDATLGITLRSSELAKEIEKNGNDSAPIEEV